MNWPYKIRKEDLVIQFYRGSGPGGQNRNKRSTACRITHIYTGIQATSETFRTQEKNKSEAFRRLATKLVPLMLNEIKKNDPKQEKSEETIRTYHEKRNEVKDHRTGRLAPFDDILEGKLELLK